MKAILLSEENFDTILQETPDISLETLHQVRRWNANDIAPAFLIPQYTSEYVPGYSSWVVVTEKTLSTDYQYDADKIKTEFVEITR